ncbi:hypothetical protein D3C87_1545320 [compost metagenome]
MLGMVVCAPHHVSLLVGEPALDYFRPCAAALVHYGRGQVTEAVPGLLVLEAWNLEGLVDGLGAHRRTGRGPQPRKQQSIAACVLAQLFQQRQHLARQRDRVAGSHFLGNQRSLHPAGRDQL